MPAESLQPLNNESKSIVYAMQNIVDRFYSEYSSNVFIMEKSNQTIKHDLKPIDLVGELIQIGSDHTSITYVIETNGTFVFQRYNRAFNVFFIDSYESFR